MKRFNQVRAYGSKVIVGGSKTAFVTILLGTAMLSAHADTVPGVDTTAVLTAVAAAVISIVAVGGAVLGLNVAVKAFRWVRAAMS